MTVQPTFMRIFDPEPETSGRIVGPNDLLIASIVMLYNGTLITNNVQEFKNIDGIKIEDWS